MKSFQSRSPVKVAVVGLTALTAVSLLTYNVSSLPFFGNGPSYKADFAEIGSLRTGEEVRIAGIKVGAVDSISLKDAHVVVTFHVDNPHFGPDTTASIEIKTLLGAEYLSLHPAGAGQMKSGTEIPLSRTTPPFEIAPAFNQLTTTVQDIDTTQLAKALTTLADTFRTTPSDVGKALTGLSALSRTISSRDADVSALVSHLRGVTGVLAANSTQITSIIDSSNTVLTMLAARQQTIDTLLTQTRLLATQLEGLVKDNNAHLAPALKSLNEVGAVLAADRTQIAEGIARLQPFVRVFTSALGSGGFFDATIKFGSNLAVCDTSAGNSPLSALLDPVLSALNKQSSGSSTPCLPLAAPSTGGK